MKSGNLVYYILLTFIPLGYFFRLSDIIIGKFMMMTGLVSVFVFYFVKIIRQVINKQYDKQMLLIESLIVFMTPVFISKYYYHFFGDYPGLIIIPAFIFSTIFFLFRHKGKDLKLRLIAILYLVMTIPLFGFDYYLSPINYIPQRWYDRYKVVESIPVSLNYKYKNSEAEELSKKALELRESNKYQKAILLFRKAIIAEPDNPELYFEISECYAFTNKLERAISILDTAILLDNDMPVFYNNRGLLYFKLRENQKAFENFKTALKLDSTQYFYYLNLALVYFKEKDYENANLLIDKAKRLGANASQCNYLRRIGKKR